MAHSLAKLGALLPLLQALVLCPHATLALPVFACAELCNITNRPRDVTIPVECAQVCDVADLPTRDMAASTNDKRAPRRENQFMRIGRAASDDDPFVDSGYVTYYRRPHYLRIGRSSDDVETESTLHDSEEKRAPSNYVRIGRAPSNYVRIGRAPSKYVRIGRAPSNYVRIGRAPSNYVRIGRDGNEQEEDESPRPAEIGKDSPEGDGEVSKKSTPRGRQQQYVRIGKSQ